MKDKAEKYLGKYILNLILLNYDPFKINGIRILFYRYGKGIR